MAMVRSLSGNSSPERRRDRTLTTRALKRCMPRLHDGCGAGIRVLSRDGRLVGEPAELAGPVGNPMIACRRFSVSESGIRRGER
jgi:hypothetical protein